MPCQVQEDVVQRRGADGDVVDRDAGVVQPTDSVGNRSPALGDGDADRPVLEERPVAGDRGKGGDCLAASTVVAEVDVDPLAADAVRRLDDAGIAIDDISVSEPTLDDVFLNLTGRATEPDAEEAEVESK